LRYRGVNLRPERKRPRLARGIAVLLTAVSGALVFGVYGFVIEITRGNTHKPEFWPAFVVTVAVTVWAIRRTVRAWRKLRGPTPSASN
jgi:hypothetical protein